MKLSDMLNNKQLRPEHLQAGKKEWLQCQSDLIDELSNGINDRKTELPKIKPGDIKGNKVRVHGKGNKTAWIYIVPPAQKIVKRRLEIAGKGDPLFGIKHPSRLYSNFRKACNLALGKEHSSGLHQLRHGAAVHYFSLGKAVQFVSKLLRHESIEITLRVYADILDDKLEDVFEDIEDRPA